MAEVVAEVVAAAAATSNRARFKKNGGFGRRFLFGRETYVERPSVR